MIEKPQYPGKDKYSSAANYRPESLPAAANCACRLAIAILIAKALAFIACIAPIIFPPVTESSSAWVSSMALRLAFVFVDIIGLLIFYCLREAWRIPYSL
jgi:hypothetical protein